MHAQQQLCYLHIAASSTKCHDTAAGRENASQCELQGTMTPGVYVFSLHRSLVSAVHIQTPAVLYASSGMTTKHGNTTDTGKSQ